MGAFLLCACLRAFTHRKESSKFVQETPLSRATAVCERAERGGFEPPVPDEAQLLSREPDSTTLAPLQSSPRRGWDSNPRCLYRHNGFQDRLLKPLGHLSWRDAGIIPKEYVENPSSVKRV